MFLEFGGCTLSLGHWSLSLFVPCLGPSRSTSVVLDPKQGKSGWRNIVSRTMISLILQIEFQLLVIEILVQSPIPSVLLGLLNDGINSKVLTIMFKGSFMPSLDYNTLGVLQIKAGHIWVCNSLSFKFCRENVVPISLLKYLSLDILI